MPQSRQAPPSPETILGVPLLGEIEDAQSIKLFAHGGKPLTADQFPRLPEAFALRIGNDSLAHDHFRRGDVLLIACTATVESGDTAVLLLDGAHAAIRKWHAQNRAAVRLEPVHAAAEPLVLSASRVTVLGRLVGLLRKY